MSGSTIPVVLAGLVSLFKTASLGDVAVIDGPAYDPPNNFLSVGWDRSGQPAVVATNDLQDYGATTGLETYQVSSLLSFSYDDDEVTVVRERMFAAFEALSAAVAADPQLGGAAMLVRITSYDLTPILLEVGAVADLRFTVTVQASR